MSSQYICTGLKRRQTVLANPAVNGIDFLEVLDQEALAIPSPRQQTLMVHFFSPNPALNLQSLPLDGGVRKSLRIEGGVRITPVRVSWAFPATAVPNPYANAKEQAFFAAQPDAEQIIVIRTDVVGDFSTYTLRLIRSSDDPRPPAGIDTQFASIDFSFKVECPSDFDCQTVQVCPPQNLPSPPIDYLAKDFSSFRTLMMNRLAVTLPGWQEQSPADIGSMLVEVLAYAADRLSYFQDAVATEAYLGAARRRISVRRHARLLDYAMHDGSNARAWVFIEVAAGTEGLLLPGPPGQTTGTRLLTQTNAPRGILSQDQVETAINQGSIGFETLHQIPLFAAHNEMHFYTWGEDGCCLPKGATAATLQVDPDIGAIQLSAGDAVLFEEVVNPSTGTVADADPTHRWVVRLTSVTSDADALIGQDLVEIAWGADDALPFPLCISAPGVSANVSVARGNMVLADHGITTSGEALPFAGGRYNPRLLNTAVTFSTPYDNAIAASKSLTQDPRAATPAVILHDSNPPDWTPVRDLLESSSFNRNFVVETDDDGTATLRFGDGILGATPTTSLTADYRTGNGNSGHVGAEAIAHAIPDLKDLAAISNVRNPLPSQGGIDPELPDQVRLYAPSAFRTQERAVTEADYAEVAGRHPQVEKAEATMRWTGTWYTMFLTVQRRGGQTVDDLFRTEIRNFLETFRLAGFDLEIEAPMFVPLDIAFRVRVAPGYFPGDVEEALLQVFSNRDLPGGGRGFFHPDNFTFGQPLYLSPMVAAAMQVPGVQWVDTSDGPPIRFQRFGQKPQGELETGRIGTGRLEIIRLDNDPNEAENGVIQFFLEGGL